jgi:uncharacterized RDD family membrane protein YckC
VAGGDGVTAVLNSEDDVVGRRIAAALVDSVLVFSLLYAGILTVGGMQLSQRASLEPAVVIGFYLWYVFAVLGFAPLLVLHDYSGIWFAIGVGLWVAYGALFEAAIGATPGKLLAGIVVVSEDGGEAGVLAVVLRNLLRVVDAVGFYLLGFLVLSFTSRRQRLGDVLGKTVVLRRDERSR